MRINMYRLFETDLPSKGQKLELGCTLYSVQDHYYPIENGLSAREYRVFAGALSKIQEFHGSLQDTYVSNQYLLSEQLQEECRFHWHSRYSAVPGTSVLVYAPVKKEPNGQFFLTYEEALQKAMMLSDKEDAVWERIMQRKIRRAWDLPLNMRITEEQFKQDHSEDWMERGLKK